MKCNISLTNWNCRNLFKIRTCRRTGGCRVSRWNLISRSGRDEQRNLPILFFIVTVVIIFQNLTPYTNYKSALFPVRTVTVYLDLRTNSDYFTIQYYLTSFYNRDLTLYSSVITTCTASLAFNKFYFLPTQCI